MLGFGLYELYLHQKLAYFRMAGPHLSRGGFDTAALGGTI